MYTGTANWGGDVLTINSDHTGSWVWSTNSIDEKFTWEIKDDNFVVKNSENVESIFDGSLTYHAVTGGGRVNPSFSISPSDLEKIAGKAVNYLTATAGWGNDLLSLKTDKTGSWVWSTNSIHEKLTWNVKNGNFVLANANNEEFVYNGGITYTAVIGGGRVKPAFSISYSKIQNVCQVGVNYVSLSTWEGQATFDFRTDKTTSFNFTQLPALEAGTWSIPSKQQGSDAEVANEGKLVIKKSDGNEIVAQWNAQGDENKGTLDFTYVAVINSKLSVPFSLKKSQAVSLGYTVIE